MIARCKIDPMCYAGLNQHVQQALADNTTLCVGCRRSSHVLNAATTPDSSGTQNLLLQEHVLECCRIHALNERLVAR